MKKVKIYLRAVLQGENEKLSLFDSNDQADFNNLVSQAYPGDVIIWTPDSKSGISEINSVKAKGKEVIPFNPKKRLFCKGFKYCVPKDAKAQLPEGQKEVDIIYDIEYTRNGKKESILLDPTIKVKIPD